ncbi:FAD/NAD(P)-binding protein [Terricaulis sp.]|uniref:FAD/NAD(P)-binding protein n=1 Tax=Terricaulis sp. TaxID=2768686 RepID=UPI0037840A24
MSRLRIAIIGGGVSGTALAVHLLLRGAQTPDVTLIERGRRIGPGLAYGGSDQAHLLNVRANNLSISDHKPDDFSRWLSKRKGGDQSKTFAPRALYGRYVAEALQRAEGAHWFRRPLKRVRGDAVALRREGEGVEITLASGKTIPADKAVLALGNPAAIVPEPISSVEVIDAWDAAAIARVPSNSDVLLVGTGLTMVDVVLSLSKRPRSGTIYALSHRGLTPHAHADIPPAVQGTLAQSAPLSAALSELRNVARGVHERGEPWQHVVDGLRKATPTLWRGLTSEQQLRFLRHARSYWDIHRHRAAPEAAARIADLRKTGKLRILRGEVVSAGAAGRYIQIVHRQRGSMVRHRFDVANVINCTGASQNLARSRDPLVMQLLSDGLVRAHATGLGLDVNDDGGVLDARGAADTRLFALGPITQGAFWESTAVPEIRARAAALAAIL